MKTDEAKQVIAFVAELLRGSRALKGYGLRKIAVSSGISIATLSRIERGGMPDALTFVKLVMYLKKHIKESSP